MYFLDQKLLIVNLKKNVTSFKNFFLIKTSEKCAVQVLYIQDTVFWYA